MPSEKLSQLKHKSLESVKQVYKQRLEAVLHKQLTVENIEVFADEALEETIKLTDNVLDEYRRNSNFKASPTTLDIQAQENEAFEILDLPNINEILDQINKVKDSIDSLKTYLDVNTEIVGRVITPPQENITERIVKGDGSFEKKKMFPRLLTLLYIIEHDFEIIPTPENVSIKEGVVTPLMMRRTPYVRVEIPELKRAVYICDEEENASYVFDTVKLIEAKLTLDEIDIDDKGDKNSLIAYHPGIGIRLIQSSNWRSRMAVVLGEEIPAMEIGIPEEHERQERSEFEKPNWLSFEEFQEEIRTLYPGTGGVQIWYRQEVKKHRNWPRNPYVSYKDKGWIGFPELVGKENRLKKEFLSFYNFQEEIISLYPGNVSVQVWFREERKKHPSWPADPSVYYKNSGWTDWSDLVGKENHLKKEWLPFDEFQSEVRVSYSGETNVAKWYHKVRLLTHPDWPQSPGRLYKDRGWKGWPELVGRENMFKKEYPEFIIFEAEVRALYQGQQNVEDWYNLERENHPNWPAAPDHTYRNIGWQGWPELVGRENIFKKEWLPFEDYKEEVKSLYPGTGGVQIWYRQEVKKHRNWPAAPNQIYKDKGWIDWAELIGKENLFKKERPDFNVFQAEIQSLFPGKGAVNKWYKQEKEHHPSWPGSPEVFYKGKGWRGWSELVGRK